MGCEVEDNCFGCSNKCWHCKFDETNGGIGENCYIAIDKSIKHPQILAAKQERKDNEKLAKQEEKKRKQTAAYKEKSKLVKNAAKTERLVNATLNSGRVNRDGDLSSEHLSIDVKSQSRTINPTINAAEFRKIQNDAVRAGKDYGVLILVNKDGENFYVIPEGLFKEIIQT